MVPDQDQKASSLKIPKSLKQHGFMNENDCEHRISYGLRQFKPLLVRAKDAFEPIPGNR